MSEDSPRQIESSGARAVVRVVNLDAAAEGIRERRRKPAGEKGRPA